MRSPAPIGLRGVRASVFGATSLLLAAMAHVAGGGPLPSLPMLVAVGVPTACAAVVLARRSRGVLGILTVLAVGQALLHEAFMSAASAPSCIAVPAAHAGHGALSASCSAMSAMPGVPATPAGSALMLLAHVIAVVATALVLVYGERTAQRLWTWLRLRPAFRDIHVPVAVQRALAFASAQQVPRLRIADEVSRRGPPRRPAPANSFA